MDRTDGGRLLDAWDAGLRAGPAYHARAILQEFLPELNDEQLRSMTLGERDRELLLVRRRLFGDHLAGSVTCGTCHEGLAVALDTSRVLPETAGARPHSVTVRAPDDIVIVARPASVDDVEMACCAVDARAATKLILTRCIDSARRGNASLAIDDLPAPALAALERRLEEADPGATITLEATCPRCHNSSHTTLDVAAFLWTEIEAEALRLLHDVHRLARGYGWREADIVSMSSARRRAYMEMLQT